MTNNYRQASLLVLTASTFDGATTVTPTWTQPNVSTGDPTWVANVGGPVGVIPLSNLMAIGGASYMAAAVNHRSDVAGALLISTTGGGQQTPCTPTLGGPLIILRGESLILLDSGNTARTVTLVMEPINTSEMGDVLNRSLSEARVLVDLSETFDRRFPSAAGVLDPFSATRTYIEPSLGPYILTMPVGAQDKICHINNRGAAAIGFGANGGQTINGLGAVFTVAVNATAIAILNGTNWLMMRGG